MKIKLYIVTYQGHKRINPTLNSLFNSDLVKHDYEVNVINNHSDIRVEEQYLDKINILHNVLRPDWSSGHLSRNWNQALINGFKSLTDPDCDVVVSSQDDSLFRPDWTTKLQDLHSRYTFVQNGHGDQFHSYLPEAVRHIGLWDERFCGISRQAADYFWRCVMYNREWSTIQDPIHARVLNPIFPNDIEKSRGWLVDPDVRQLDGVWDNASHGNDTLSVALMEAKYPADPYPWTPEKLNNPPQRTLIYNHVVYPYFEKDVYNLKEKAYLV
tara:strand:+ start:24980 stop:25789 length:810 start_codon:yes stop_codon:yes gene_type:complete